jgi:hypothetical protein
MARERWERKTGECEGQKSLAEIAPEAGRLATKRHYPRERRPTPAVNTAPRPFREWSHRGKTLKMTMENLTWSEHLERAENLAKALLLAAMNNQQGLAMQGIALNLLKSIEAARELLKERGDRQ